MTVQLGDLGGIGFVLYGVHHVCDYWAQTHAMAERKAAPTWTGRAWCAAHTAVHVAVTVAAVAGLAAVSDWHPTVGRVAAAAGTIAVTHYWADRRVGLRWLAGVTGHEAYWHQGGSERLDQAWHIMWLVAAAVILAS